MYFFIDSDKLIINLKAIETFLKISNRNLSAKVFLQRFQQHSEVI